VHSIGIQCAFKRMIDLEYNQRGVETFDKTFTSELKNIIKRWKVDGVECLPSSPEAVNTTNTDTSFSSNKKTLSNSPKKNAKVPSLNLKDKNNSAVIKEIDAKDELSEIKSISSE